MGSAQRRAIAAAAAGLASLVVAAGPAMAERVEIKDDVRDVWSPEGAHDWTHEGSVRNTDLVGTTVAHTSDTVVVRADYRNLIKDVPDEISLTVFVRTSRQATIQVLVFVDNLGRYVSVHLSRAGVEVTCDDAVGHADFRADVVRVTVPRSCLGNPEWIRYRALAESYREALGLFRDSALARGPRLGDPTPRIERG